MKRIYVVLVLILIALGFGYLNQQLNKPEVWNCKYEGLWYIKLTNKTEPFNWRVDWQRTPEGWNVQGNYRDQFGKSFLEGFCQNFKCLFTQTYRSGSSAGQVYYYQGQYTDKQTKSGRTINTFKGTWGHTDDNRKSGGTWEASAKCKHIQ